MVSIELYLLTILRALAEIAAMFLLAQGVLFLLIGGRHRQNLVYQLFCIITRPVIFTTRSILPQRIGERRIPVVAFVVLFCLWLALAYVRQLVCQANGLVCA